jgi:predicted RND superfamily exporter protein
MEIQSITSRDDTSLIVRNYKNGLDQYKKRILKSKEAIASNRNLDSLLITTTSESQREKLINEEVAMEQMNKIDCVKRTTIEMEHISLEICKDLNRQTETMKGVQTKLTDVNKELQGSNSLISRMMRREHRNRAIITIFSVGFVMTFLVILYFKLFPSAKAKL